MVRSKLFDRFLHMLRKFCIPSHFIEKIRDLMNKKNIKDEKSEGGIEDDKNKNFKSLTFKSLTKFYYLIYQYLEKSEKEEQEASINELGLAHIKLLNEGIEEDISKVSEIEDYLVIVSKRINKFIQEAIFLKEKKIRLPKSYFCINGKAYNIKFEPRNVNWLNEIVVIKNRNKYKQEGKYFFPLKVENIDCGIAIDIGEKYEIWEYESSVINIMLEIVKKHIQIFLSHEKEKEFQKLVAGETAHKIKTPISLMAMWLDDLKEGLAKEKIAFDYFRCIEGIEKELERAETTVKRFLKMESIIKTKKNVTDVNLLIQQALKEIPSVLDFFSDIDFIPIEFNIFVKIDFDDIIHAIKEILVNAMKYGETDTVLTINIKLDNGENIQISIINDGEGLNKEDEEKIFNPLSNYKGKGFGFGLILAKDLIKSDGGEIHLGENCEERTKEKIGRAEFIITLPINYKKVNEDG